MTFYSTMPSPVGEIVFVGEGEEINRLFFSDPAYPVTIDPAWKRDDDRFAAARRQLEEYFAGERTDFDLPLAPVGTPFQQDVWRALREIPYGVTTSYAAIAVRIGRPSAVRAVGAANGRNPIGLVVPCHRVIGANGKLVGYAGGLDRKAWLLDHERGLRPDPLLAG